MKSWVDASYSFSDLKKFLINQLTMENRCFYVGESKSNNSLRIDLRAVNFPRRSSWQQGVIRTACEEILIRMSIPQFRRINVKTRCDGSNMVLHAPLVSKHFLLNNAIEEAIYIILGPYVSTSKGKVSHPKDDTLESLITIYSAENEQKDRVEREGRMKNSNKFLTQMAMVAWDFLNLSSIFQPNRGDRD